ncbi:MAG: sulfotransferase family protein [Angustibacter sp.]
MAKLRSTLARALPSGTKSTLLSVSGQPDRQYNRPAAVPRIPAGWAIADPDFVGIGAQKSGTSWWYSLLARHPRISPPKQADARLPKELHFFDRFWDPLVDRAEIARYREYFPRPEGMLSGEWTPRYLADPWTIGLLAQAAPNAKILVLLRDPIDRYHSGLTHSLAHGLPRHARTAAEAVHRGFYGAQLRVVLQNFPKNQILVQQYEACRLNPQHELHRTLEFLGVEPHPEPLDFGHIVNGAARKKVDITDDMRAALQDAYRADCLDLGELFPDINLDLWDTVTGSIRRTVRLP